MAATQILRRITSYLYFQYAIAEDIERDAVRSRGLLDALHEVRTADSLATPPTAATAEDSSPSKKRRSPAKSQKNPPSTSNLQVSASNVGSLGSKYDVLEFRGRNGIFSNFAFTPMVVPRLDNKKFYYLENAYQAGKSLDPAVWEEFTDPLLTPGQAKRKGQLLKMRPDWEEFRVEWMYELLKIKFAPALNRRMLLGSMNGSLVEGNLHHDNFWGACVCDRCADEEKHNILGKLLMKLRHSYIE